MILAEMKIENRLWKLRWWICECKLKVQNWYSSWILVCYISSNLPPDCIKLHRFYSRLSKFFGGGGMPPDPRDISSFSFISNSRLWYICKCFIHVCTVIVQLITCDVSSPISRIPDQNGISKACYMVEIYHSGLEPSIRRIRMVYLKHVI